LQQTIENIILDAANFKQIDESPGITSLYPSPYKSATEIDNRAQTADVLNNRVKSDYKKRLLDVLQD
jgi:hypothetical protein